MGGGGRTDSGRTIDRPVFFWARTPPFRSDMDEEHVGNLVNRHFSLPTHRMLPLPPAFAGKALEGVSLLDAMRPSIKAVARMQEVHKTFFIERLHWSTGFARKLMEDVGPYGVECDAWALTAVSLTMSLIGADGGGYHWHRLVVVFP
mmetsp:Transcript_84/g.255  ORF Transcript_84/g.255 Transcript_84/m.255 type:complete len:147 (+) Transcript_84:1267-1707(+)